MILVFGFLRFPSGERLMDTVIRNLDQTRSQCKQLIKNLPGMNYIFLSQVSMLVKISKLPNKSCLITRPCRARPQLK